MKNKVAHQGFAQEAITSFMLMFLNICPMFYLKALLYITAAQQVPTTQNYCITVLLQQRIRDHPATKSHSL